MRNSYGLRIAEGVRDLAPEDLCYLEQKESCVLKLFEAWSYRKVLTTGLEYGDCVEPEMRRKGDLYKFFDREGQVLALRPEFTTPIARLVSTRLRHEELPLRLCYSGDVYRSGSQRYREFRQSGVELIGSGADMADAEVIALAIEMMRGLGLRDFKVSLGHVGVFSNLADELGLDGKLRTDLEDVLARKDIVMMNRLLEEAPLDGDNLCQMKRLVDLLRLLPSLTGGEEVLDRLRDFEDFDSVRRAVDSLRNIYGFLRDFGVRQHVAIDLGILREFAYYSGTIFEGYVPEVGFPVLEGGRYDWLYSNFGLDTQATGFAFNLEALLAMRDPVAARGGAKKGETGADVLVYGSIPDKVIRRCQELRREGKKVEMALGSLSKEEACCQAEARGILRVEPVDR
ncbi:MAG: ATP phosphoribosyltransferase regulatory subunit [Peptococcaceae bacterium]|nr:ATP phosphoribosyltransferase regulatory subunit [Peptococcaceae bacterium]